jgi:potassium channel LctB
MAKSFYTIARRSLDRFSAVAVERASLLRILIIFGALVIGFAGGFWLLARYGDAVRASGQTTRLSIADALYFSVITISSLGYGDLAPTGVARLVACVEVLVGLAMMGLFVAKLSSARVGFLVRRLYATDAQARLNRIGLNFSNARGMMSRVMGNAGLAFAETPDATPEQQQQRAALSRKVTADFDLFLMRFRDASSSLYEYLQYEIEHGDFFGDAPLQPVRRTGETITQLTFLLAQLIIALPAGGRIHVFQPTVRERLNEALQFTKASCDIVVENCPDVGTTNVFTALRDMTDRVPQELFNVPTPVVAQPDQILPPASEPQ